MINSSKMFFQSDLNSDWERVEKKIEQSKIFRIPYKSLLGVSLTKYILDCRDADLSSDETMFKIFKENNIQIYMVANINIKEKIIDNIKTSVSARYSEERSRGR